WPPSKPADLLVPGIGLLDMTLRPTVKPQRDEIPESDIFYSLLRKLYTGKAKNTDSLRSIAQMDKAVRIGGERPDFDIYPQVMDMRKTVAAVKSGEPVEQTPINDPEIIVITSPNVVHWSQPEDTRTEKPTYTLDLLVFIKSCTLCFQNREQARRTYMLKRMWRGFRVRFLFVVGLPYILQTEIVTVRGVQIRYPHTRITNTTQLKEARERLFRESRQYGDLLIGGFRDSYYNLTTKLILTFRWASVFCIHQTPIFLFLDDDFAIIPVNMVRFLQTLNLEEKLQLIGGLPNVVKYPGRPSADLRANKWAVDWNEYPWETFPGYLFGRAYM
ncbi:unnamed protein product, partial [Calicophoron daubneyi]